MNIGSNTERASQLRGNISILENATAENTQAVRPQSSSADAYTTTDGATELHPKIYDAMERADRRRSSTLSLNNSGIREDNTQSNDPCNGTSIQPSRVRS